MAGCVDLYGLAAAPATARTPVSTPVSGPRARQAPGSTVLGRRSSAPRAARLTAGAATYRCVLRVRVRRELDPHVPHLFGFPISRRISRPRPVVASAWRVAYGGALIYAFRTRLLTSGHASGLCILQLPFALSRYRAATAVLTFVYSIQLRQLN